MESSKKTDNAEDDLLQGIVAESIQLVKDDIFASIKHSEKKHNNSNIEFESSSNGL